MHLTTSANPAPTAPVGSKRPGTTRRPEPHTILVLIRSPTHPHPASQGLRENVAWKDFCEDVLAAHKRVPPDVFEQKVAAAARGKGEIPGKPTVKPVLGWQPE